MTQLPLIKAFLPGLEGAVQLITLDTKIDWWSHIPGKKK